MMLAVRDMASCGSTGPGASSPSGRGWQRKRVGYRRGSVCNVFAGVFQGTARAVTACLFADQARCLSVYRAPRCRAQPDAHPIPHHASPPHDAAADEDMPLLQRRTTAKA